MASGVEMMISAIVKAIGLNPDDVRRVAAEAFPMFQKFCVEQDAMAENVRRIDLNVLAMHADVKSSEARIIAAINGDLPELPDARFAVMDAFAPIVPTLEDLRKETEINGR